MICSGPDSLLNPEGRALPCWAQTPLRCRRFLGTATEQPRAGGFPCPIFTAPDPDLWGGGGALPLSYDGTPCFLGLTPLPQLPSCLLWRAEEKGRVRGVKIGCEGWREGRKDTLQIFPQAMEALLGVEKILDTGFLAFPVGKLRLHTSGSTSTGGWVQLAVVGKGS